MYARLSAHSAMPTARARYMYISHEKSWSREGLSFMFIVQYLHYKVYNINSIIR